MRSTTFVAACATLALVASAVAVAAPAKRKPDERRIEATGFTGVALEGEMNVVIEQGNETQVIARGTKAALADLDPVVEKGVLRLKEKKGFIRERLRVKSDVATVTIRMPNLTSFSLAGAGNATFKELKTGNLELKIAGSGDIDASGSCKALNINLAGSGDINAKDFKCEAVAVKIAGAGDVSTYASRDFSARIMGAGSINVYGNPVNRSRSVFGAGDITYVASR